MNETDIVQIIQSISSDRNQQLEQILQNQERLEEIATIAGYGLAALIGIIIGVFVLIPFFKLGDKL